MIEPTGKTYCMRCCNDKVTCNRGISEKGCAHVIPGDYSGPLTGDGSSTQPSVSVSVSSFTPKPASTSSSVQPSSTPKTPSGNTQSSPASKDNGSSSSSSPKDSNSTSSDQVSAQSVNSGAGVIGQPILAVTLLVIVATLFTQ
ncbi:hypothetical protein BC941DRAFT_177370 [Chlamydoabsidia padenii]|nr:hypothetical protein BC941DRAFT_177370 [Chlamydoabsidia padenii]